MNTLELLVEEINPESVHKDFRLWLTSMPSDAFPVSVLHNGVKMTNEPPKGLRANLYNAYYKLDDEKLNVTNKPHEYKKLLFALSFFHALVQERVKFGALGWNIPYEFDNSDLEISTKQLELYLNQYDEVPYEVLSFMTNYINYGGRVTDAIDLRTIDVIMRDFFCPSIMDDDYKFSESGIFYSINPGDGEESEKTPYETYVAYINGLPLAVGPEIFGLHDNADIVRARDETIQTFNTLMLLQPRASGGGGASSEDIICAAAKDIEERLQQEFDIESISMKFPVRHEESMNTVLVQECLRYNKVITVMRKTLPVLQKALRGLVVLSQDLEQIANSIFVQETPAMWDNAAYPCLKPLTGWVNELMDRLSFVSTWSVNGVPEAMWISGFYFPQAFLTGTLQNYARKYDFPIDACEFEYVVKNVLDRSEAACRRLLRVRT